MQGCEQEAGLLSFLEQVSVACKEWMRALHCLYAVLQTTVT